MSKCNPMGPSLTMPLRMRKPDVAIPQPMPIFRRTTNPAVSLFTPIGNKTLARRLSEDEKVGAIILPQNSLAIHMATFEVISCGPKCENFKPGDHALMPRQLQFSKIELGGETFEIVPEDQFAALVDA